MLTLGGTPWYKEDRDIWGWEVVFVPSGHYGDLTAVTHDLKCPCTLSLYTSPLDYGPGGDYFC